MVRIVFTNGRVYAATGSHQAKNANFETSIVVDNSEISFVGNSNNAFIRKSIEDGASVIDLQNRIVVPGLIEAHTHFMLFGMWLRKLDISHCKSLQEIQSAISEYAKAHPELPRLLCRGWHQSMTNGVALAAHLDDIDPRPIFIESEDLHSTWCNTAALEEVPLENIGEADSPSTIPRDARGNPTGLLAEMAHFTLVCPHKVAVMTMEEKVSVLEAFFDLYVCSGYTGAIDLAMDAPHWEALQEYRKQKEIPIHIAAHWLIANGCTREELVRRVDEAIELHQRWHPSKDPEFCIVGIKLILDGVVDGCTAAASDPFPGHNAVVPPIWDSDEVNLVLKRASDAGLQCAIHAVGDVAITQAINAIEYANGKGKRHRLEHIEFPSADDLKRIGELEITASIQPGHCDPFTVRSYPQLVGPRLWNRAFPYKKFLDNDAVLAIGTDAPSASYLPMPTLYTATTRKSARDPKLTAQTHADQALALAQAIHAFTAGAAYSRRAETWSGSLSAGMRADFIVLDAEWEAEKLLDAKVIQTWSKGTKVFQAEGYNQ
ncbi:Amidohydrolase family [Aspergillus sclerotialis]|uniref:Amidohydrolase family n=1 Tax=Aspergillus sclerotialis TaxID=2070753 RepID=A0A3A2ZGH5_9EURO|nr:Amidohydrolase family [Aspergillus sclerotialis]